MYNKLKNIFLVMLFLSTTVHASQPVNTLTWTMINVNHSPQQGDSHLIQTDTNKNILIDTGHFKPAEDVTVPFLKNKGIKKLHKVFVSHPHQDHYGGLLMILNGGIKIEEVYFNLPDKKLCDTEIPWGCNYTELLAFQETLRVKGVKVLEAKPGMKFNIGAVSDLEILYAYDGVNTPVGGTDINDMSLIMKLSHASSTALLTGDLNNKIGEYLSKEGKELKADILKLPHHGTEGAAPDTFYDAVAPKVAMVPSPALLWCSARSARMKKWVETNKVSTYVNGFSGHVMVRFNLDGFKISEQKKLSASQRNNICK